MCAEPIAHAQLLRDLHREILVDASLYVDHRELGQLGLWVTLELLNFTRDVRLLRVALRTDGNIFAHGHRHRSGDQARNAGDQNDFLRSGRCGNANHEACRRYQRVVGSEHRGAEPRGAVGSVSLVMSCQRQPLPSTAPLHMSAKVSPAYAQRASEALQTHHRP